MSGIGADDQIVAIAELEGVRGKGSPRQVLPSMPRGVQGGAVRSELKAGMVQPPAAASSPGWLTEPKATKAAQRGQKPGTTVDAGLGQHDFRALTQQLADAHERAVASAVEAALAGLKEENRVLRQRLSELGVDLPAARASCLPAGARDRGLYQLAGSAVASQRASQQDRQHLRFSDAPYLGSSELKDGLPDLLEEGASGEVKLPGAASKVSAAAAGPSHGRLAGLTVQAIESGGSASPAEEDGGIASFCLGSQPIHAHDEHDRHTGHRQTAAPSTAFDLLSCWADTPRASVMQGSLAGVINLLTSPKTVRLSTSGRGSVLTRQASTVAALKGASMEPESKSCAQRLMCNPGSVYRCPWDIFGMFLIIFDSIFIPLGVYPLPRSTFVVVMEWLTRVYWTVDIPLTFTVGYFQDGIVVMEPKRVAMHYLRSTFIIDVAVVTIDWAMTDGNSTGILRIFRAARVLRLVRLFKLKKILVWIQDHVNSEYTSLVVDFMKLVLSILLLSHFTACIFWYIGTSGPKSSNWISDGGLEDKALDLQYVATLYWGLTSLLLESTISPTNTIEYLYCILIVVCGLIGFSTIVSRITSLLLEIQNLRADTTQEVWKLRRFFRQVNVPPELRRRIMRYLEYHEEQKRQTIQWSELPILDSLTPSLRSELRYVGHMQAMEKHPLFEFMVRVSDVTMRRISEHALEEHAMAEGDPLFFQGEVGSAMEVLSLGHVLYIQKPPGTHIRKKTTATSDLSAGLNGQPTEDEVDDSRKRTITAAKGDIHFLAEPCLWLVWHYMGDAYASSECVVITLNADAFGETVKRCTYLHAQLGRYAVRTLRHVRRLQEKQTQFCPKLTDVWDKDKVNTILNRAVEDMARQMGDEWSGTSSANLNDDDDSESEDQGMGSQGISTADVMLADKGFGTLSRSTKTSRRFSRMTKSTTRNLAFG